MPADGLRLVYLPASPRRSPVEFGVDGPIELDPDVLNGLASLTLDPQTAAAAGQYGTSIVAHTMPSRTLRMRAMLWGDDAANLFDLREQVAGSLWIDPTPPGGSAPTGVLQLHRPGKPTVEVDAVGWIEQEKFLPPFNSELDITWLIPDPRWRGVTDGTVTLAAGGGWTGPLTGPLVSLGANISLELTNVGTAPAPIVARIYGALTTPRLRLIETGQVIEVTGPVAAGEHLLIDTSATRRRVQIVAADGTVTDATRRLNLDLADFFQLPPGVSTVRLEADDNPSGSALITWRARMAGV